MEKKLLLLFIRSPGTDTNNKNNKKMLCKRTKLLSTNTTNNRVYLVISKYVLEAVLSKHRRDVRHDL